MLGMKRETDTEFLARMIADGFSSMESRFDTLEVRAVIQKETYSTNQRIDQFIAPSLDDHARRIKDLELERN
jgi:hypothetical protein